MSLESSVLRENKKIENFKDLLIWQKGMKLVEAIYEVSRTLPKSENYGLCSQIQKAAVSIPSNIAEGFRRKNIGEYKQFLGIALGSCGELETQIEIAKRLGYIDIEKSNSLIKEIEDLCKMTQSLIKKLRSL